MTRVVTGPCEGLTVVEVAVGVSDLGLGLAGGLPGMWLADLGADVTRVVGTSSPALDASVPWGRVWHRDKQVVRTDDAAEIRALLETADIALVYGSESLVEERGLGYRALTSANPGLVHARCRPSLTERGAVADYGLLVEARSGFCTQLAGHRDGPIFVDVHAPGMGAAALLTTSVLGLLRRRHLTGAGGWAETTLYDGMLATLGCMIGRSERAAPEIESYWEHGSTFPNFLYRCADGELVQVWFGGKGMYPSLLEVLGDEPSEGGYYADQMSGRLGDRAERWVELFAKQPRAHWIEKLREAKVACEPVFGPGEVLAEAHLLETGLAQARTDDGHQDVMVGSTIAVSPLGTGSQATFEGPGLLSGLRVVDFSAFVAGPLAAEVLADLGADVVKVEPPGGEAMRAAAYAIAACQRGKRSLALDIGAPEVRPVVEALLRSADVVLHNFRVGVAERLGIDAATVAEVNPGAVYCHASAFGATGPRAKSPGNDALMQALTGFETGVAGEGNTPTAATWIPIDMTGGWVAATGILAALQARAATARGQSVVTSLLGAGMLLHSGVFQRDGELVAGPRLDQAQTGYGPGYRIYECAEGTWVAVVIPDQASWDALASLAGAGSLPPAYAPVRNGSQDAAAAEAERVLETLFATRTADQWVADLAGRGPLVERVVDMTRDEFRRGVLEDPVNRQLGRVVEYDTDDWGHFEQIGPLLRYGPLPAPAGPPLIIPGVGEHSVEVLRELGFGDEEIAPWLEAKVVRQLGR